MIEQKHLVDEKITFSSLDRSTNLETLNRGLPLDDNYKSCTSVLEKGNSNARRTTAIVTTASSLSNALTEGFTAASTGINVSSIGTVSLVGFYSYFFKDLHLQFLGINKYLG